MTNPFAKLFPARIVPVLIAMVMVLPEAHGKPPFVQPDLVIRHQGRKRGEQNYIPNDTRPLLIIRRRNLRPVNLGIELNGDTKASAVRRDVRVAVIGPRENRRATFRYFFNDDNISGMVTTGNFSGFVDPGFNVGNLTVQVVPKKRRVRRKRNICGVIIRAFDQDAGKVVDSVRAILKKR